MSGDVQPRKRNKDKKKRKGMNHFRLNFLALAFFCSFFKYNLKRSYQLCYQYQLTDFLN